MLSLDFNFVLEMINLVILYLLLRKFLIGPVHEYYGKAQGHDQLTVSRMPTTSRPRQWSLKVSMRMP